MLFRAEEVIPQVCECAGGTMKAKFTFVHKAPKVGRIGMQKNGLVGALIRYGKDDDRFEGLTDADVKFAINELDKKLMDQFRYRVP